ncbi:CoA transferase, partial [Streptosporangium sp. NPDC051023]|uniref:CaiB/BaiF CoA transferase family protein n=1 Tax=Streptosporangium sp. NPDC051023 TaxID=3155410 RepID=UPI0034503C3D
DVGDEMRAYAPRFGEASANYALLNRGKRAFGADLKDPVQRRRVLDLAREADIVIEQFRPGVADRLGLGYAHLLEVNPRVIYCSISGYGPEGEFAHRAGHDLNYLAESGLLGVVVDGTGAPSLPPTVIADIAGGTYPAVVNILLALRSRDTTGAGCHIELSMAHNLQMLSYGYFASYQAGDGWPRPGKELLTGGSPRYHVYPTKDGRHVACAALEQKFWDRLTELIGLDPSYRDDVGREPDVIAALTALFASESAQHWRQVLGNEDVCTSVVATFNEAVENGLLDVDSPVRVATPTGEASFGALAMPISRALRKQPSAEPYPVLSPLVDGTSWAHPGADA